MSTILKVKYFNSFWLKKVVGSVNVVSDCEDPVVGALPSTIVTATANYASPTVAAANTLVPLPTWPGIPWNPSKDGMDYPTFPWGAGFVNCFPEAEDGEERQWFVEESRIRGGYNNVSVDLGKKAYIVEDVDIQQHRINALIYSGVYNSRTGVNETNVFSISENISKAVDPAWGSIQKLYAYHNNLDIYQENKCSHALIDKDAIYSAEGTPIQTQSNVVIGQVIPYQGEYGISKNPESFATYGYARYFSDQNRGCIIRLSRDGITEISNYGMRDYFRDVLSSLPDAPVAHTLTYFLASIPAGTHHTGLTITFDESSCPESNPEAPCSCIDIPLGARVSTLDAGIEVDLGVYIIGVQETGAGLCVIQLSNSVDVSVLTLCQPIILRYSTQSKILGGWDIHQKYYTISPQNAVSTSSCVENQVLCDNSDPCTLAFDEGLNGWVSFFSYQPMQMFSLKDRFYTIDGKDLYQHYDMLSAAGNRNVFYGISNPSRITFVFNPKISMMKNFKTIEYEGSNGWEVTHMEGDPQEFNQIPLGYDSSIDTILPIFSYNEGAGFENGIPYHGGFDRKENRYVANIRNNSTESVGEVEFGASMSGIKGYYSTVTMSTDQTTNLGGIKALWAVSTNYVMSSM